MVVLRRNGRLSLTTCALLIGPAMLVLRNARLSLKTRFTSDGEDRLWSL